MRSVGQNFQNMPPSNGSLRKVPTPRVSNLPAQRPKLAPKSPGRHIPVLAGLGISLALHAALLILPASFISQGQETATSLRIALGRAGIPAKTDHAQPAGPPEVPVRQALPPKDSVMPSLAEPVVERSTPVSPVAAESRPKPKPALLEKQETPKPKSAEASSRPAPQAPADVADRNESLSTEAPAAPAHMNETGQKAEAEQGQGGQARDEDLADVAFGSAEGPSFRRQARLVYPEEARRQGREGKVILRLRIDARGRLVDARVVKAAGHGFDEAALRAITASSYRPAERNGRTVECVAVLAVRFHLKE